MISSLYEECRGQKHTLLETDATMSKLRQSNVKFATGYWTNTELNILYHNIKSFKQKYNVKQFATFYENAPTECCDIESKNEMYIELGKDIMRPLRSIRAKLDNIYLERNNQNGAGSYTESETKRLISLQKRYGSDWKYISTIMNRTPGSLANRFQHLIESYNIQHKNDDLCHIPENLTFVSRNNKHIRFTPDDDRKLAEGVKRYKNKDGKPNWKEIASYVGTHTTREVRSRWEVTLKMKKRKFSSKQFSIINRFKITIRCLRLFVISKFEEKIQIDWDMVAASINMGIPEGIVVKAIFHNFVSTNVPNYTSMNYEEILHYLLKNRIGCGLRSNRMLDKKQSLQDMVEL